VVVHTFHGHHLAAPFPKRWLARLLESRLAERTTAAVCLSPSQRRDLVEVHRVLPPEKAVVIGPGIDVAALRASVDRARVAAIRAEHAPAGGGALFLWLGRFVKVKDPLLARRAVARAGDGGFRLVLAGEGPLLGRTRPPDAETRLRDVFRVVGPVLDPWNWISAADGVVLTSRSEGTPIVVVEAACLGRPVVATQVGGVPDLVRHEETGLLVPPRDARALASALERLASDAALRRRLGERATPGADERFGAARLVRETADLYRSLLERGAPPPTR
jgi:glycosyltransferase involved in cell wall biosynthesis